jgi:hypothetical protein
MPEALPLKPASRIAGALNGMLSAASSFSSAAHGDAYTLAKRSLIYTLEQSRNIVNHNGYPVGLTASGTRAQAARRTEPLPKVKNSKFAEIDDSHQPNSLSMMTYFCSKPSSTRSQPLRP